LHRRRAPAERGGEREVVVEQQVLQRSVDEQEDARLALAVDAVHLMRVRARVRGRVRVRVGVRVRVRG